MRDPTMLSRGELLELRVAGGQETPDELRAALARQKLAAGAIQRTGPGRYSLRVGPRAGVAHVVVDGGSVTWWVLLADPRQLPLIDAAAVFAEASRGAVQSRAVASPWGARAPADAGAPAASWGSPVEGWLPSDALVGRWMGTVVLPGGPLQIALTLEPGGRVIAVERKGKSHITRAGSWAVRDGYLRLDIDGREGTAPFQRLGSRLVIDYDGAPVTLHKRSPK